MRGDRTCPDISIRPIRMSRAGYQRARVRASLGCVVEVSVVAFDHGDVASAAGEAGAAALLVAAAFAGMAAATAWICRRRWRERSAVTLLVGSASASDPAHAGLRGERSGRLLLDDRGVTFMRTAGSSDPTAQGPHCIFWGESAPVRLAPVRVRGFSGALALDLLDGSRRTDLVDQGRNPSVVLGALVP